MNEIATGPVAAVPLVTTHVDRSREVVPAPTTDQTKIVERVTVIDTYDWRGAKSSVSKEHTVSWLV